MLEIIIGLIVLFLIAVVGATLKRVEHQKTRAIHQQAVREGYARLTE